MKEKMSSSQLNMAHFFPICEITMITENSEKLTIRIDRGHRPTINFNSNEQHVQIYVPVNTVVNYQTISQKISFGYTIHLQRMQQQYKITLQHTSEKKAECVIFASSLAREQEIKTTVKEVNSRVSNMTIAGTNLEVVGVLKGNNLTFESTVGTMHVYAKITCTGSLNLHSQNVVLSTESLLSSDVFKAVCRKLQIDGRVLPLESETEEKNLMIVELACGLVHIGVDGCIGGINDSVKNKLAQSLDLSVSGDLANYGKILAKNRINLAISGNLISLSDGSLDSAGRGYNALKKLRKIDGGNANTPSSSSMHNAIQDRNAGVVANLIEKGVDLNDTISNNKSTKHRKITLRQTAIAEYKDARSKSNLNSVRERITLINALFVAHDWRRGVISSADIHATIERSCEDLAQFSAKSLRLNVAGSATVERDSIWSCTWVEIATEGNVQFDGQTKLRTLTLHTTANVITTNDAILSCETFGRVKCANFECDGMWWAGESLAIDAIGNVILKDGSYMECEKFELDCGGECEIDGTWKLFSCWAKIQNDIRVQSNARLFIEDCANITGRKIIHGGFWHVSDQLDLILQESANFLESSRLEAMVFKLCCKKNFVIAGGVEVNDCAIYVRNDLLTLRNSKIVVTNNADVICGLLRNESTWQIEKNFKATVGSIEQSENGILFVKLSINITIHEDSLDGFGGRIISGEILFKTLNQCTFDGLIRCNEMQISVPYIEQSLMSLKGQVDVVAGCLTISGNLKVTETSMTEPVTPAVVIGCNLTAAAIISPFASVHISETAIIRLNGLQSHKTEEFNVLINAGALSTAKNSAILSMAAERKCEALICATKFHHQGQVRFSANMVNIISPVFVHEGRFTNVDGKQNHVRNLLIHIGELLLNNGILACDVLEIVGDGILENTNRIYAVESMDIKMRNFNNTNGLIESKNAMKLLAVSKEWTNLSGTIKAKNNFDVCANRLNVAIRNVQHMSIDKRLTFSAKTDLMISSDVIDDAKELSVGYAAQQSIAIHCQMQVDRVEVLLGSDTNPNLPVSFNLHQDSNILANTILVNSKSDHVQVQLDGSIDCKRLRFTGNVKTVSICGSGNLQSCYLVLPTASISFEMYSVIRINEIQCLSFDILNDHIVRLESCADESETTIVAEDINIDGTLFLEKRLFVKSREGIVRLSGSLFGSSPCSEFACEAIKMVVRGQIGNFKFAELFARESISIQNEKIRNVEKLCVECSELGIYNAEIESCRNISITCDSMTSSGYIHGDNETTMVIHSINIHSKMDISNMKRISVFCKRSTAIKGRIENLNQLDIDSKWINLNCDVENCENLKLTAWAIVNNNQICASKISATALSVFVNNCSVLAAMECELVATFILSLTPFSTISAPHLTIHSLCLGTRNDVALNGTNYMWLCFDPLTNFTHATNNEMSSWKSTSTMLRDRWMTSSIDADEMLIGLKYISDLNPIKLMFGTKNRVYDEMVELCSRFENTPISLFNFSEFITILQSAKNLLQLIQDTSNKKRAVRKTSCGSLYESLVQFKHGKYCKELNDSSDTDIGYVSRSSSEDLNSKTSRPRSPLSSFGEPSTSFFDDSHLQAVECRVNNAENELLDELQLDYVAYAMKEEEELAEFEELEDELEMAEEGIIRTDFIVSREKNIYLAKLKENIRTIGAARPKMNVPLERTPSSNDLILKKLQVKHALSSLDLRSFGSQSSLTSLDFGAIPDFGSPLQFNHPTQFHRSKIPLGSFRAQRSRPGTPSLYSSTFLNERI